MCRPEIVDVGALEIGIRRQSLLRCSSGRRPSYDGSRPGSAYFGYMRCLR